MKKVILVLGIAGLLFAGYLSAVKLFSRSCALGETCPNFLGHPACYYGFGMYLLISIFAVLLVGRWWAARSALWSILVVSGLGILFAGNFTLAELPILQREGFSAFTLGLPTCTWGLVFYVVIFILTLVELSRRR